MSLLNSGAEKGPVAWMAKNPVAANLLMAALLLGGLLMSTMVKQEVFPEFSLDIINVSVAYPGASPAEVEQGIVTVVEEAVRGLDGVLKVTSQAFEGIATINIELIGGTDNSKALGDIKAAVDRIVTLPEDAERPNTSLFIARNMVISMVLYGDHDEETLRRLADKARDELMQDPHITQIELAGVRAREISVEVPQAELRAHNLTLGGIAEVLRQSSVELPAGSIKAAGGETLLRTAERRDYASEFADVAVVSGQNGTRVKLSELATVRDTFADVDLEVTYNGLPAVQLDVYRVGDQTPIQVAEAVKAYAEKLADELPAGIKADTWNDRSQVYADRVDLLLRNAKTGLILVFIALALFLEIKLAFWVMMGIPISFAGAFLLMPVTDVSINMISLFAFIVTLGIVVDDAIVVGENIYEQRERGLDPAQAAVRGTREVAGPVVFSVLTTVAAFSPLLFMPGVSGKFFGVIPIIVVLVLLTSLVESLFILPAHLAHSRPSTFRPIVVLMTPIEKFRSYFGRGLNFLIKRMYAPFLRLAASHRYLTIATGVAMLIATFGLMAGGHLNFTFMPKVEGDTVTVTARLPEGVPIGEAEALRKQLLSTANAVMARHGGDKLVEGTFASIGQAMAGNGPSQAGGGAPGGSHVVDVAVLVVESGQRTVGAVQLADEWRAANANLVGVKTIAFSGALRAAGGLPIDIALSHRDTAVLELAAARLAEGLRSYVGITDIDSGIAGGKPQLDLALKPAGRALDLNQQDLARQVRDAFYGAEALRQMRGRDEVRVMVRLPVDDRRKLATFEDLTLRGPRGGDLPISEVAEVTPGRAYTQIQREEGRRVLHVTGDVDANSNAQQILGRVQAELLPQLMGEFPGLSFALDGASRDTADTFASLRIGGILALFAIFALLAVPFRSYVQPLVIMAAIPFGLVGALGGHVLLGYDLSVISVMGIVALSGIVVNDSLVMLVAINELRAEGVPTFEAVVMGAVRRFRPILLTSITTFFGLMPMIFETSVQARFLIPMAISLGFGVMFSTFVILLLVPALYLAVEDFRWIFGKGTFPYSKPPPAEEEAGDGEGLSLHKGEGQPA
jgi:multidrug efflux pump subunit AcrB